MSCKHQQRWRKAPSPPMDEQRRNVLFRHHPPLPGVPARLFFDRAEEILLGAFRTLNQDARAVKNDAASQRRSGILIS